MTNLVRNISYGNDIIIVDGMWRTGKSLLGPIVGAFEGVQKPKIDYNFEWSCILHSLGSLSIDDASLMLKLHADLCTHNNYLGREMNFRPKDDSGIFKNPNKFNNLRRIFISDGNNIQEEIKAQKPPLMIITHSTFQVGEPLVAAYGKRLKMIVVERNPVFYLEQWAEYLEMIGSDPRELEITKHDGFVPWFILDIYEDEYKSGSYMDKSLIMYRSLREMKKNIIAKDIFDSHNLLTIPYESLVYSPSLWIEKIGSFLNKSGTGKALKFQKQLNLPRKYLLDGIESSILKERRKDLSMLEIENYNDLKQSILNQISVESIDELSSYISEYENSYDFQRLMPWSPRNN